MRLAFDPEQKVVVARRLERFARKPLEEPQHTAAAVALVLSPNEQGDLTFLLTRRPLSLTRHGGQFALPGGKLEAREPAVDGALRELEEELGIDRRQVEPLGLLDDFATRSGFVVTPVVVWTSARLTLRPDPAEVAVAYRIPIHALYRPGAPRLTATDDPARPLLSFPLLGTSIHSPTAAFLYQLRAVAFDDQEVRVAHFEQPRFAWK